MLKNCKQQLVEYEQELDLHNITDEKVLGIVYIKLDANEILKSARQPLRQPNFEQHEEVRILVKGKGNIFYGGKIGAVWNNSFEKKNEIVDRCKQLCTYLISATQGPDVHQELIFVWKGP